MRHAILAVLLTVGSTSLCGGAPAMPNIPADFPVFSVPGHEPEMGALRELFWRHYPAAGPKATMWDEWLPAPSLWPASQTDGRGGKMRSAWRRALGSRRMDAEGYVATHQHASIAHQDGWPFPAWHQGRRGCGWHFSFQGVPGPPWRPEDLNTTVGWELAGAEDRGVDAAGWNLHLCSPRAVLAAPPQRVSPREAPYVQIRWRGKDLRASEPYIEWTTAEAPEFSPSRRMYFDPPEGTDMSYAMVPVWRHPGWSGEITRLRVGLGNREPGGDLTLQAVFAQYDTRHNINNLVFPVGCATYFWWTRDLAFLRENLGRMRTALAYAMTEFHTREEKVVYTTWPGHDGRSGFQRKPDGKPEIFCGEGIGSNYWDLLPFGHKDCYATIRLYHALNVLAKLEREVRNHPEWNMPASTDAFSPEDLESHAAEVKRAGNELFWSEETGRFVAGVNVHGEKPDYGFTFLNNEAVHYDFATPEHAERIVQWTNGERVVAGDTSQTTDIYSWRFGPRATTKRNLDYYMWVWHGPESIPWGGQVQDGGAVLGFSYHDLMARLKTRGADNAWARLKEVLGWFREVQEAGGYRTYYDGTRPGTLQGGGTAGGLGLDEEFFESVLVPQVVVDGFLGLTPCGDGFQLNPKLPGTWPEISVSRIAIHDLVLSAKATSSSVSITLEEGTWSEPHYIRLPEGNWSGEVQVADSGIPPQPLRQRADGAFEVTWTRACTVYFRKAEA